MKWKGEKETRLYRAGIYSECLSKWLLDQLTVSTCVSVLPPTQTLWSFEVKNVYISRAYVLYNVYVDRERGVNNSHLCSGKSRLFFMYFWIVISIHLTLGSAERDVCVVASIRAGHKSFVHVRLSIVTLQHDLHALSRPLPSITHIDCYRWMLLLILCAKCNKNKFFMSFNNCTMRTNIATYVSCKPGINYGTAHSLFYRSISGKCVNCWLSHQMRFSFNETGSEWLIISHCFVLYNYVIVRNST